MLNKDDPRMKGLVDTAAATRAEQEAMVRELAKYSDEELNLMLDEDESLREFMSIDADRDNGGVFINYANQPQNQQQTISFQPSWISGCQQQQQVPQFYNGFAMNWGQQDKRVQMYNKHPGMRLYNLNPYQFYDDIQLEDYYNYLENQRAMKENMDFVLARIQYKISGDQKDLEWAEQFKFKAADDIVKERIEAQRAYEEKRRIELYGEDGTKTVYGVYDANGYRFERSVSFKVRDRESGEIVLEVNRKKDENGHSYEIHSIADDRKEAYRRQVMQQDAIRYQQFNRVFASLFNDAYFGNIAKWRKWDEMGLDWGQKMKLIEDERVDWAKHEKLIQRALMTASYSREKFSDILKKCCHTELDYANKSTFFSLSYDFERDLKYKSLISTPEEMENDPMVHQKLQEEYEIKRKMFMQKVASGNLGCDMTIDAHARPAFPKPNLDSLTLEDFDKPENQVMYTQLVTPEIATQNKFIPDNKSKQLSEQEILAMNGVKFDANGNIIPQSRIVGVMTVNDDTGQVIAKQEWDMTQDTTCRQASNDMSDEELSDMY